jgi:hypothetical protein
MDAGVTLKTAAIETGEVTENDVGIIRRETGSSMEHAYVPGPKRSLDNEYRPSPDTDIAIPSLISWPRELLLIVKRTQLPGRNPLRLRLNTVPTGPVAGETLTLGLEGADCVGAGLGVGVV